MSSEEREQLRRRFDFRCGYCGVREFDVGAELTCDHFQPQSRGGKHHPENWVYGCHACNEFKGDYWAPDADNRILHPLRDDVASHLVEEEDGTLKPLTSTGAFHIERLHLNRRPLVAYRRERCLLSAARQKQAAVLERLQKLEEEVQAVIAALAELKGGG